MKATLEFDLPEEQSEFDEAYNGGKYAAIIFDADNYLRNWLKHGHEFKTIEEALEAVRQLLREND